MAKKCIKGPERNLLVLKLAFLSMKNLRVGGKESKFDLKMSIELTG